LSIEIALHICQGLRLDQQALSFVTAAGLAEAALSARRRHVLQILPALLPAAFIYLLL
jgi:hypothetical protein